MATYTDESRDSWGDLRGLTTLVLVGDGLWTLTAEEAAYQETSIRQVSSDPLYRGAYNISIAQASQSVSIWFSNSEHTLGYQRAGNDGTLHGRPVPLCPAGTSIDYAAILDLGSRSQSLIVASDSHRLLLMEQAAETGMWNTRPLLLGAPNSLIEINAFVSHVELRDDTCRPFSLAKVNLSSSGWVNLIVNGTDYSVGAEPVEVQTDAMGTLTIVQPSDDVSGTTYTLSNAPGGPNIFSSGGFRIDPSVKVQGKLGALSTPEALRRVGAEGRDEDVAAAAKAISKMHSLINDVSNPTSRSTNIVPTITSVHSFADVAHVAWDFWEWVKAKASEVTDFIIEKLAEAWRFVVKIAGQVWSFVLDSAAAIIKGITFVLDKVGLGLKKLWEYVQYVFNWEDIKTTYSGLKSMVNASLDFAADYAEGAGRGAVNWFDGLEKMLGEALNVKLPEGLGSRKHSSAESSKSAKGSEKARSVEANTATYQFNQGAKSAQVNLGVVDEMKSLYQDVFKPALEEVSQGTRDLTEMLTEMLKKEGSTSVEDILKTIGGSIVHLIVSLLKGIVSGITKLGSRIIKGIKSALNTSVLSFGVLGGILKTLHVPDFSILDIVAIVTAIPVTVLAKTITGKPPRRIHDFNPRSMVANGKIDKESAYAMNELASYVGVIWSTVNTLASVTKMETAELPTELEAFSSATLCWELLLLSLEYPYDKESAGWDCRFVLCLHSGVMDY